MVPRRIVLVGALLLVVLGLVATVDYTGARDHRPSGCVPSGSPGLFGNGCRLYTPRDTSRWDAWETRKVWYGFAGGAIIVLTGAAAFAAAGRSSERA